MKVHPVALGCDVTTAGVELFMGKTPSVQFYCNGLNMCGPFGLSAYAFAIISTSVAAISPDTLVPPPEISLVVFLPCLKLNVLLIHITPLLKYILQSFMYSSFCYFQIIY